MTADQTKLLVRMLASTTLSPSGCMLWNKAKDKQGYGFFKVNKKYGFKTNRAHRAMWFLTNGDSRGLCVLHKCDNPSCVNPSHLFLGTHGDNAKDKIAKGRHCRGEGHGMVKLSDKEVEEIRRRYAAGGIMQDQLAEEFGITSRHVSNIVTRSYRMRGSNVRG